MCSLSALNNWIQTYIDKYWPHNGTQYMFSTAVQQTYDTVSITSQHTILYIDSIVARRFAYLFIGVDIK